METWEVKLPGRPKLLIYAEDGFDAERRAAEYFENRDKTDLPAGKNRGAGWVERANRHGYGSR